MLSYYRDRLIESKRKSVEMNIEEHTILVKNLCLSLGSDMKMELIQTHISTIILSGDLAYKLKRPVDFGFLDYSTFEKRHHYTLEEIRINDAYAPGLYLGAIPITGTIEAPAIDGEGDVLEYAVKMRRFEQADQLDNIVEGDGLSIESMDAIAKLIAQAHAAATPVDVVSDHGEPKRLLSPMLENFEHLEEMSDSHRLDLDLSSLTSWVYEEYERLSPLLRRRKSEGFIRQCHGDIHLHNMAMYENKLILFDAIEFNPYLNHIDVISDLAFLLMDLEYRGLKQHSHRLLNAYLELTGDYEAVRLLDFYKSYRAMVRAKVAALSIQQSQEADERDRLVVEVSRYIVLAQSYTEKRESFLAITHGLSGSGKSTFALMMVEKYGTIRIRSDVERMRMFETKDKKGVEEGIYTPSATSITYKRLAELAKSIIKSDYPVILDATFLKRWQREMFYKLTSEAAVVYRVLDIKCDIKHIKERVERRSHTGSDISEADLDVLKMQIKSAEAFVSEEEDICFKVDCTTLQTMQQALDRWSLKSP